MSARESIENLWDRATPVGPLLDQLLAEHAHEIAEKIRAQRVKNPYGEAEEHLNWALGEIANDIDSKKEDR
jgi:hypothetical protein